MIINEQVYFQYSRFHDTLILHLLLMLIDFNLKFLLNLSANNFKTFKI